jgi:outer membrane protein assembly factor BamE (lipoprotein component of BamABCDE complex)
MKRLLILVFITYLSGCVGSPIHSTLTYGSVQKTIKKNNAALMKLKAGMGQDEVRNILGEPERSEGYPWGSAWLYRTAMTKGIDGGIYGAIDADYTPVMFDNNGILQGWGRNYFEQYVNRYELTIKRKD